MYVNMVIHFNNNSHLIYDANKDIFIYIGKFANRFLNHCIKHQITDSELILDELCKIQAEFDNKNNINLFNTIIKNESDFSCSNCNDSGIVESYEDKFICGHCENSKLIENFNS